MEIKNEIDKNQEMTGVILGVSAYVLWGLLPLYWRQLGAVAAFQILAHRIVWAFIFTLLIIIVSKKAGLLAALLKSPKKLLGVGISSVLITLNWGLYIWAVNDGRILETSLGYYLNPLVSVLLGVVILKEKIDNGIRLASGIAAAGIIILSVAYGAFPWVALSLAFSFALYSLSKKMLGLDSIVGLMAETAMVTPFALVFLYMEHKAGRGAFLQGSTAESILLGLSGIITATPLLLFSAGVKRLRLSRMGFLQYISPTLQLILGVFVFGEKLGGIKTVSFVCVFLALIVFIVTRKNAKKT